MNDYFANKVFTNHGIKEIGDITPYFDHVYHFRTGKLLTVTEVVATDPGNIYYGIYTDGRATVYHETDQVYIGYGKTKSISDFAGSSNIMFRTSIDYYEIPFDNIVKSPLPIDPYILGVLYSCGDFTDKYVNIQNIPLSVISEVILNKNWGFTSASSLNGDKYYLHIDGQESKLEWDTFFNPLLFMSLDDDVFWDAVKTNFEVIPDSYKYASTLDRLKFIRGVLDISYNKEENPDNIAISSTSNRKIKEIQSVLLSVGILSTTGILEKDHQLGIPKTYLSIIDGLSRYPSLFGKFDNIEYMLDIDNKIIDHEYKNRLRLKKVLSKPNTGWTHRLRLLEPRQVFLSSNYLPLVSL